MDLNLSELKQLIGREINSCLQPGRHPSASEQQLLTKVAAAEQLPKLSSDVTLTKVAAPERLAEKEKEGKVGRPLVWVAFLCTRIGMLKGFTAI